ncbi:MAG: pilus assembly protein [Selenomonas sp.]|uniref:TadE/TadG family type IV pilus assembly protein n=1 Tax=Selenomonas sp. TaxID=2053611 RepID=UPI0025F07FBE|nr:TadE/TadG family type IV pilus assembly protein [Selenomonas sp.]MCR5757740.1 pilus assembly protein [Selenomonas sp.]
MMDRLRQKGQAAVEFALVLPLFILITFGVIYGGMVYMDYLQYSNAARAIARDVSLADTDKRAALASKCSSTVDTSVRPYAYGNEALKVYVAPNTSLYSMTSEVTMEDDEVKVTVSIYMNNSSILPNILRNTGWPPTNMEIVYQLPVEPDV